jgi:hypothetical protein
MLCALLGDLFKTVDIFNQCPAGCFFSDLVCSQCAAGSYIGLSGQSSCIPCPPGTSNPSLGSNSSAACSPCAIGTYSGSGQPSCSDCPSGSYCPDPARSPVICPAGSHCPAKSSTPAPCLSESYSGLGQPSCSDCPSGSYCPDQCGSPVICPAGSHCPAKSGTPVKCDLGFLCAQDGLSQQLLCPSGHYCPSSVHDVPCPAGTFSLATGACSGVFNRVVACNRACCFPRTLRAGADSHSLFRPDVCVHLPALLPFAELPRRHFRPHACSGVKYLADCPTSVFYHRFFDRFSSCRVQSVPGDQGSRQQAAGGGHQAHAEARGLPAEDALEIPPAAGAERAQRQFAGRCTQHDARSPAAERAKST